MRKKGDLENLNVHLEDELNRIKTDVSGIIKASKQAKDIVENLKIAIIGPANSGKSTLMNRICDETVSIVSSIEGTTRDILEVNFFQKNFNFFSQRNLELDGLKFKLMDMPGIRDFTEDEIEEIGINMAM